MLTSAYILYVFIMISGGGFVKFEYPSDDVKSCMSQGYKEVKKLTDQDPKREVHYICVKKGN